MKRKNLYTESGEPKRVRCYMQKRRKTFDYITVVFTYANKLGYPAGTVIYRGTSEHPTHPQGFGQWGEQQVPLGSSGSMVKFNELPLDCQKLIREDYAELWGEKSP